jgi:hypothetical protein
MAKLEWNQSGDMTTDGRYWINSETVRGEGRWHWLMRTPPLPPGVEKPDGSNRLATVRRRAQRLEDLLEAYRGAQDAVVAAAIRSVRTGSGEAVADLAQAVHALTAVVDSGVVE